MSENRSPTKTRDVLVETCPKCNALHIHGLTGGIMDGLGKSEAPCGVQIGWIPPEDDKETQLKPLLCDYVVKPTDENTFTVRHFSLKERQEYNTMLQAALKEDKVAAALNPKLMEYVLLHGVAKSPFPLAKKEDLEKATVDGITLEAVYYAVLEFNAPPLAPLSGLRQLSTPTPPRSAITTP